MMSAWTHEHVAAIADQAIPLIPRITAQDAKPLIPGEYLWDMWPVQDIEGRIIEVAGTEFWMVLSAPNRGDPLERHFAAKIRLLHRIDGQWHDRGLLLPDWDVPYQREWSGSAVWERGKVTLYFTGAGLSDAPGGYQQRLFETTAPLSLDGSFGEWTLPVESVCNDGRYYLLADDHDGEPGKINAFRDPSFFCDPQDGNRYLIFSASLSGGTPGRNGAIGVARFSATAGWELLPPLVHADGVNNEMERAHAVFYQDRYYLFWVTQTHTFAPESIGPTGLYGMVADRLFGPYRPLNGTGLIAANPPDDSDQTYSWYVSAELIVCSFIGHWGLADKADKTPLPESFGGTVAPLLSIALAGDRARLVDTLE